MPISELPNHTHIHGLAVDPQDPSRLLIATHHGLFRSRPDGMAERISDVQDFMGFNATSERSRHPLCERAPGGGRQSRLHRLDGPGKDLDADLARLERPGRFPPDDGKPGRSEDDLRRLWQPSAQPGCGKTWSRVGPAPDGLIDLAASAKDADTLYAATEVGAARQHRRRQELEPAHGGRAGQPCRGHAGREPLRLRPRARPAEVRGAARGVRARLHTFGDAYLLHLAGDPADPGRLFGATGEGQVLASTDRGRTWAPLAGSAQ